MNGHQGTTATGVYDGTTPIAPVLAPNRRHALFLRTTGAAAAGEMMNFRTASRAHVQPAAEHGDLPGIRRQRPVEFNARDGQRFAHLPKADLGLATRYSQADPIWLPGLSVLDSATIILAPLWLRGPLSPARPFAQISVPGPAYP